MGKRRLKKHPHVRGEDFPFSWDLCRSEETPPRAWGRRMGKTSELREQRNTPTCVGKTQQVKHVRSFGWKHPHVRGEDTIQRNRTKSTAETPPRAWGRRCRPVCRAGRHGNTPTCVGKTARSRTRLLVCQKHPHVRGEDILRIGRWTSSLETPPRAWGRH